MTPPSTFIAPHLRETVFGDCEGVVAVYLQSWPDEVGIDVPANRARTTFVANLRNAILSARKYNWPTALNLAKLRAMTGTFLIRPEADGKVWMRRRTKHSPSTVAPVVPFFSGGLVPWRDCTQEEVEALCVLLSAGRLIGPYLVDGPVGAEQVDDLSTRFNVGLVFDETKNQTIII